MQLSTNISLEECIKSNKAKQLNINNIPSSEEIENLRLLAVSCLQPIRNHFNKALLISSGFRCTELNKAVGGSNTSQHIKGQAVDFIIKDTEISDVIKWIKDNITFDQLIDEYARGKHWIHISYSKEYNRKEVLKYEKGVYTKL